jgi:branched-chain amino acid transport system substrate-binding protein
MRHDGRAACDALATDDARGLTRRSILGRGLGGAALLGGGALLAACGSSSKTSSSAATAATIGNTSSSASGSTTAAAAPPSAVGEQLQAILGTPTGKAAGEGMKITIGTDLSLSGSGTSWGIPMYDGVLLGAAHVKAAGGPTFNVVARDTPVDNLVGNGTSNTREFGAAGIPAVLTSQGGGGGAGAPFYPRYNMFAIDSGGANVANEGKPFLYQGRMLFATGSVPPFIEYTKLKNPQVKRIAWLAGEITSPVGAEVNNQIVDALKNAGYSVTQQLLPVTATDFTTALGVFAAAKPDLILVEDLGLLTGVLLKQYLTSGINASANVVGFDYNRAYASVAGPTELAKYQWVFDFFDSAHPPNEWGKLFVQEFQRVYKQLPDYYAANYYETTFLVWELVRRIIAAGGDPTKQGDFYVNAFAENPNFPSVYGYPGSGGAHGTSVFSLETHTVIHRPVSYGQALAGGNALVLATADTTGTGFKLTPAGEAQPTK